MIKIKNYNLGINTQTLENLGVKKFLSELNSFYEIVCNVIETNVDPKYIIGWRPAKSLDFGIKAMKTLLDNKSKAKSQVDTIRSCIAENSLYMQAAYLAHEVYFTESSHCRVEGWHTCDDFHNIQFNDKTTGLVSRLFMRINEGKKEYIYVTAGTNPICIEDWKNNVQQLYGGSAQYGQALENAKTIAKIANAENAKLFFVGHSLGGGLATNNALHTGCKAIVFNPAGVSKFTTNGIVSLRNEENDQIVCFIATNDVLNLLQDISQNSEGMKLMIPPAIGKRYYLHAENVLPIKSHTMTQMIANMEALQ